MLNKFQQYYQKNKLFTPTAKILLTVSGGKDSMAMLHLFKQSNLPFGVAHCNFQLRRDDANLDEQFVRQFCKENKIDFHTTIFNTQEYANKKGISIQMAARDLRYDWFEKVRTEYNYQYIATAHHKNDVAETMLINLTKGTGLAGLHGIKNKYGYVIRPLLCFNRVEIETYVKENNIPYREDNSNTDTKYTRNAIRHKVIPELEKINPALIEVLNNAANQFLGDEQLIKAKILEEKKRLFVKDNNGFKIEISVLHNLKPLTTYLYYFFRDYGFNAADILDIITSLENQSGKTFYSSTHQIVRDRAFLLLRGLEEKTIKNLEINSTDDFPFRYQLIEITPDFKIEKSNKYAYLDADKVDFPLTLRAWQQGDTFQPLGMNGKKKISDFLIDNKISVIDKSKIRILKSGGQILWLVGHRIDDRCKITPSTKKVLLLSVNEFQ